MYLSIVRNPAGGSHNPGERWSLDTKGGVRPATHCVIFNNLTSSQRATLYNMDLTNLGRLRIAQCEHVKINDISVISVGWLFVLDPNF